MLGCFHAIDIPPPLAANTNKPEACCGPRSGMHSARVSPLPLTTQLQQQQQQAEPAECAVTCAVTSAPDAAASVQKTVTATPVTDYEEEAALPGPNRYCMPLAAGCWLLAACCWLLAAGCWLLAAG